MKKRNLIIATVLVAVAASVAFVSCKKENQEALQSNSQPVKTFTVPQIDDMNAYLREFKQKMQESQNSKDVEYLSLEEAAWHLSSVANYDYANVNVEYTDLRYDTLYYQVNITNGQVALSDLNAIYESIASDIDSFYQSLDLQEKHFRFIGAYITTDGQVIVELTTSYIILDHTYYFGDDYLAAIFCFNRFDQDSSYIWNTSAKEELESAINFLEGHEYIMPGQYSLDRVYYVFSMTQDFQFQDNIDLYGSDFLMNSRIFAAHGDTYSVPTLDFNTMCYCVDSYLGLGFEYVNNHSNLRNQRPVRWIINCEKYINEGDTWHTFCHKINVTIAQVVINDDPNRY